MMAVYTVTSLKRVKLRKFKYWAFIEILDSCSPYQPTINKAY
jgi:hypothetical protein